MKSLFLGLGKVNTAIADYLQGERKAFVEEAGGLGVYEPDVNGRGWKKTDQVFATFDTFDWAPLLPAKVFISPGVDPRRPFFKKLSAYEIRELDLFSKHFKGRTIAVTGTDGKSTFTSQLGELLKRAMPDKKIFVGGNLGVAMMEALLTEPYDLAVLEISSFQAERLRETKLDLAVLLNLDTDHLDRYDRVEDYHLAKWQLLEHAEACLYPSELVPPMPLRKIKEVNYSNHESLDVLLQKTFSYLGCVWGFKIESDFYDNLPRLPHRMEEWSDQAGRVFIDDSKATTVHAVCYALRQTQPRFEKVRLVLGGRYKGDDFSKLVPLLRASDEIFVCGEAGGLILKHLSEFKGLKESHSTLAEALKAVLPKMRARDCLLLSPGCSSYDQFKNFEERGRFFISEIKKVHAIQKNSR